LRQALHAYLTDPTKPLEPAIQSMGLVEELLLQLFEKIHPDLIIQPCDNG